MSRPSNRRNLRHSNLHVFSAASGFKGDTIAALLARLRPTLEIKNCSLLGSVRSAMLDFRYGSVTGIEAHLPDVCFTPQSRRPQRANSQHLLYSDADCP